MNISPKPITDSIQSVRYCLKGSSAYRIWIFNKGIPLFHDTFTYSHCLFGRTLPSDFYPLPLPGQPDSIALRNESCFAMGKQRLWGWVWNSWLMCYGLCTLFLLLLDCFFDNMSTMVLDQYLFFTLCAYVSDGRRGLNICFSLTMTLIKFSHGHPVQLR